MRVRAKVITKSSAEKPRVVGYFNGTRIREGEEFDIDPEFFTSTWMEKIEAEDVQAPAKSPRRKKLVNEVESSNPNVEVI